MNRADPPSYRLIIAGPAARTLAGRLLEKVATAVYEFITTTLSENPHRLGKNAPPAPYEGIRSARRGAYRVMYEIDDVEKIVTVVAIEHRSNAYRSR
ncbi:mRNA-degrading endonuclease RelE of RelBE toxin-antitoxin system [Murinocardiopsis flavida]|uniref:mRNA-degrading endonuclease RelE of RelBE toxin-antitoxin system n=1 Tax=Murinocardiopsis flavida TaxID=645275 RepID=A0A2P8D4X6_9ACTN|nr:type II toxin-antitoxin system RelE/ParE family toxin [Murinocardiopsis flavida]PSK92267.1 mRNA-degrading endonuclease RelE of RelBE toxin-antitoxin system [Murinocardiopsis flavida]